MIENRGGGMLRSRSEHPEGVSLIITRYNGSCAGVGGNPHTYACRRYAPVALGRL